MQAPKYALLLAGVAAACVADVGGPTTPEYDVIDLGALLPPCAEGTWCSSRAYDINDAGIVVGFHTTIGPWVLDGTTLIALPLPPDSVSVKDDSGSAVSVNLAGQVVGHRGTAVWGPGVLWTNGVPQVLLLFPNDIDDAGRIVGAIRETHADDTWTIAAIQSADSIIRIGTLGGRRSEATGISSAGLVVGWSYIATASDVHAFMVPSIGAGPVDLGVLPGAGPGDEQESTANAVNSVGEIVGWSDGAWMDGPNEYGYAVLPVVWRGGTIVDLGTLGGRHGLAMDINELGWIVGGSVDPDGQHRATLWREGEIVDLGSLPGYAASHAYRLNEAGDIVGYSFGPQDTRQHHRSTRATLWRRIW